MSKEPKQIPKSARFLLGGSAGISATIITQPLDMLKNRMQMSGLGKKEKQYKTSIHALTDIVQKEGFLELYNGLSAGVLRQATYTTSRMGIYSYLLESLKKNDYKLTFPLRVGCGLGAGVVGAFIGTPADVAMIRMTSDGRLPPSERRNYRHVFDALIRIVREEGVLAMWTGVLPTIGRAMVVNAVQLSTYSTVKEQLIKMKVVDDNILCHFLASMMSGFLSTVASLPIDIAKTRMQNMKIVDGRSEYSGMVDVIGKVVAQEGVLALWKGFTPYYARLGPHTVLTFIFMEEYTRLYRVYVMKDTSGEGSGF
ncbi:mitochondrial 2-oxoglutarate/malate carrier protein-like [Anabrus simplex]|uniref:mitochondrial 2-oxoglutarate/malate carrier protein-like n=1 Tax=Anabrus simplex TaxID=316456 RepID=UPI0035A3153F